MSGKGLLFHQTSAELSPFFTSLIQGVANGSNETGKSEEKGQEKVSFANVGHFGLMRAMLYMKTLVKQEPRHSHHNNDNPHQKKPRRINHLDSLLDFPLVDDNSGDKKNQCQNTAMSGGAIQ